ncbi:MAG: hypothetical protein ABIH76_06880 [Candidatus Bathyarchaeota archaeon]
MPQTVVCRTCGELLYKGAELKPADEVIQQNEGICPKCKKPLTFKVDDVQISPAEGLTIRSR